MIDCTVLLKRFTVAYAFLAQLVDASKMGMELVNLRPFIGVGNKKAVLDMQKEITNALGAILLPLQFLDPLFIISVIAFLKVIGTAYIQYAMLHFRVIWIERAKISGTWLEIKEFVLANNEAGGISSSTR